jgi:hypothetical protein
MKRTLAIFGAFVSLIALQSPAHAAEGDRLISVQDVTEGNVTVSVPTVRRADGSVCVGYIESTTFDKHSELTDVRIGAVCGMPRPGESTPAQLISLGHFTSAGLTVQTPTETVKN